jgi:hypothetical protein
MATMLLSMKVKKVQLSTLEMVGGEAKAHTFFALEYPSISYGVTGKGHTHLACSVMKLEIVHAKQAASPTAAVLRYYAEAKHVADGRSSMPQLHFEYTQHASSAMATLKIFLYRPLPFQVVLVLMGSLSRPQLQAMTQSVRLLKPAENEEEL